MEIAWPHPYMEIRNHFQAILTLPVTSQITTLVSSLRDKKLIEMIPQISLVRRIRSF